MTLQKRCLSGWAPKSRPQDDATIGFSHSCQADWRECHRQVVAQHLMLDLSQTGHVEGWEPKFSCLVWSKNAPRCLLAAYSDETVKTTWGFCASLEFLASMHESVNYSRCCVSNQNGVHFASTGQCSSSLGGFAPVTLHVVACFNIWFLSKNLRPQSFDAVHEELNSQTVLQNQNCQRKNLRTTAWQ